MLFSFAVLALLASVQGRAVNISNTWVLPEEGFPVFYRYFRDRISWYEADAVCQFHHANLVTVDTTAQYDAVRAYLKELDISNAVWVGLIRSNPDGDFTWTDYRGLSGDGYWSSAPDSRSAPLCAAADPAADYRWEARACGGPTVASFICELPVPQWALGNEGCMVRALPALTILYLPESAAVQLTADCGMAGVKKVQCTGNVKREDLLKELSCADEEELSSTLSLTSTGSNWPASTDSTYTDQETTNQITTEQSETTKHEIDINEPHNITVTSIPRLIYSQTQYKLPTKIDHFNRLSNFHVSKNINLGDNVDNNVQSNFIPKTADEDNILTNYQLEKLEDERHMQHKMLHEEIARVGNVESIFTQPTDHFIPPLVMAKAKISDDMTVLSLAEKHAQQLADKEFSKQNLNKAINDHPYSNSNYGILSKSSSEIIDKPLTTSLKTTKQKDTKKESLKSNLPKKYVNDKHYESKNKIVKISQTKATEDYKLTEVLNNTENTTKDIETTTVKIQPVQMIEDFGMDLTVLLNDAPLTSEEKTSFSGDIVKLETIENKTFVNYTKPLTYNVDFLTTPETKTVENVTMEHEIIKITIIADDDAITHNTTVFDITTKVPVFRDSVRNNNFSITPSSSTQPKEIHVTENLTESTHENTTKSYTVVEKKPTSSTLVTDLTSINTSLVFENITTAQPIFISTETTTISETKITTGIKNHLNITEDISTIQNEFSTTVMPIAMADLDNKTSKINITVSNESIEKNEFDSAEYHEILMNITDHHHTDEEDTTDSDFQSPLLSGVMEPMHRPPRTRRPQQPNKNKFNPFRILG